MLRVISRYALISHSRKLWSRWELQASQTYIKSVSYRRKFIVCEYAHTKKLYSLLWCWAISRNTTRRADDAGAMWWYLVAISWVGCDLEDAMTCMIDHQILMSICPRPKHLEAEIFLIKHGTCLKGPKPRQGTLIRDSGFKSISLVILHSNIWRTHITLLNFTESLNSGFHL